MLKMLKISCFKQNHCISGMPQGIPIQFLLNSGEGQVIVTSLTHIHSGLLQNFFLNFSIAGKFSKCLK